MIKNGSNFLNVRGYLFYHLTYMTIWLNFVNIKDYRAEKVRKSEKINRLFSRVTETFLHRIGVARCGSSYWCGSDRKKGL